MPRPSDSFQPDVAAVEARLVEIARLGLIGDNKSLRQKLRNLQRGGRGATLSPHARAEIAGLVADTDAEAPFRGVARSADAMPRTEIGIPRPVLDAEEPVLDASLREAIAGIVREHEHRHLLEEANLAPTTRLLLTGPPGSGKTMTARWIAHLLDLPLAAVEPSAVLSSLLGESAKALAASFRRVEHHPCVLLLDELDVFARRRSDVADIAEPKRLVNTLLLELDRVSERTIVVAATNHPEALDPAVVRRFQAHLEFARPSEAARAQILDDVVARAARSASATVVAAIAAATSGRSASDMVDASSSALRRSIIDKVDLDVSLANQFLAARYIGRNELANRRRVSAARTLARAGLSERRIADLLATKPTTVSAMLVRGHVE